MGTGYLFNGNSGDTVRGYNGRDSSDRGLARNPRAILTLSNGSKIYDFAGNVAEWVMKDQSNSFLGVQPGTVVNNGAYK